MSCLRIEAREKRARHVTACKKHEIWRNSKAKDIMGRLPLQNRLEVGEGARGRSQQSGSIRQLADWSRKRDSRAIRLASLQLEFLTRRNRQHGLPREDHLDQTSTRTNHNNIASDTTRRHTVASQHRRSTISVLSGCDISARRRPSKPGASQLRSSTTSFVATTSS